MLVDDPQALEQIFEKSPILIATHCEDEGIITHNKNEFIAKYGDEMGEKIFNNEVAVGMTEAMVRISIGEPDDVKIDDVANEEGESDGGQS